MTDRELRKLSRVELLEMLVTLSEENEKLKTENEELRKQLADRSILIEKAGSIAEASMEISGVFKAAQDAADRYLENIKRLGSETEMQAGSQETENRDSGTEANE